MNRQQPLKTAVLPELGIKMRFAAYEKLTRRTRRWQKKQLRLQHPVYCQALHKHVCMTALPGFFYCSRSYGNDI